MSKMDTDMITISRFITSSSARLAAVASSSTDKLARFSCQSNQLGGSVAGLNNLMGLAGWNATGSSSSSWWFGDEHVEIFVLMLHPYQRGRWTCSNCGTKQSRQVHCHIRPAGRELKHWLPCINRNHLGHLQKSKRRVRIELKRDPIEN